MGVLLLGHVTAQLTLCLWFWRTSCFQTGRGWWWWGWWWWSSSYLLVYDRSGIHTWSSNCHFPTQFLLFSVLFVRLILMFFVCIVIFSASLVWSVCAPCLTFDLGWSFSVLRILTFLTRYLNHGVFNKPVLSGMTSRGWLHWFDRFYVQALFPPSISQALVFLFFSPSHFLLPSLLPSSWCRITLVLHPSLHLIYSSRTFRQNKTRDMNFIHLSECLSSITSQCWGWIALFCLPCFFHMIFIF